MPHVDLETLLKHYTEGRISKKEFVYLHSLLNRSEPVQKRPSANPLPGKSANSRPNLQSNSQQFMLGELQLAKPGPLHFFKARYKSIMAFMGSLWIFATLALNYYNHMQQIPFPESGSQSGMVQQTPLGKQPARSAMNRDIKSIAESLMRAPIWDAYAVNELTTEWIMLSADQKDKVKNAVWFERFIDTFKKQVKFELARRNEGGNAEEIETRQRALIQLAVSLNMVRSAPESVAGLDDLLSPPDTKRTQAKARSPEKQTAASAASTVAAAPKKAQSTTVQSTSVQSNSKASSGAKAQAEDISGRDIVDVIDQYVAAFEKGSSRQILALFADDSKLRRPLTLKTVSRQYKELFRHSDQRWVEFRGLRWENTAQELRGKGKLRTSLRLLPDGEYQTVTTDVMLAMSKIDNVARITDFRLSDESIFVLAHSLEQNKAAKTLFAKDKPKHPTQSELQDIVTQYVDSYQAGDLSRMMELFSSSTWTADPAGLEELRRDYSDLFQSTSDRQVFISNVDWSYKDNKAMGTGDLVINLLSGQDHKITKKKGKLRLIVEKSEQKARISHLFQIVN